jgi:hypothetical protein
MKIPIVKEYGSWAVFIFSCVAGLITGLLTRLWQTGKDFSMDTLLTILGLMLLINSKNPLSSALRTKSESTCLPQRQARTEGQRKEHLLWFMFFSLVGFVLLIPFLTNGIKTFLFFSPLVLSYMILLSRGKEHYLLTELNGFALLTLSAPIIYFVITGEMSLRLYLAVFIFFAAGVLKVRVRIKKTLAYRWLMIFYCTASLVFFYYLNISVVVLLPLLENIISVLWMREETLKTTGNAELIKGVIFIILLIFFWQ